jgi:hypothetical protein
MEDIHEKVGGHNMELPRKIMATLMDSKKNGAMKSSNRPELEETMTTRWTSCHLPTNGHKHPRQTQHKD